MKETSGSNFLVTTSLKDTWPSEGAVLFLGEWCKDYSDKKAWQDREAIVMPYIWNNRELLELDYRYLQDLYERILPFLAARLNELHGTTHDLRYWRILVGPWLNIFTHITYERWIHIKKAERDYSISGTYITATRDEVFVPADTRTFVDFFISSEWNYFIYSYIIRNHTQIRWEEKPSTAPAKEGPAVESKGLVKRIGEQLMSLLDRHSNVLITGASLSRKLYIELLLKKGLLVKKLPSSTLQSFAPDMALRSRIAEVAFEGRNEYEHFLWQLITLQAPVSMVEQFHFHTAQAAKLPLPLKPVAVLTGNVYYHEDFRFWLGTKFSGETKARLFIMQHGGGYGIAHFFMNEEHEIKIADTFLSWGWSEKNKKVQPLGMLKANPFASRSLFDQPDALLILKSMPLYSYKLASEHFSSQMIYYFQDQIDFIDLLPVHIRAALVLRPYYIDFGWCVRLRVEERFPEIRIAAKSEQMETLSQRSRVIISTYNSTTFLETMAVNVPTLMFWNPAYNELKEDAIPFFEELKNTGIFHASPASAAAHLSSIWDDIGSWWTSPEVQAVVQKVVASYCAKVKQPAAELARILLQNK